MKMFAPIATGLSPRPFTPAIFQPGGINRSRASSNRLGSAALSPPTQPGQYLPRGPDELVQQALGASQRAFADGIRRQYIEMLIPLIGASDLDDWPGGIRQQFKAAAPMVESLLRSLKTDPALQGPLNAQILDDGDAVGAWTSPNLAAILFPTAESLKEVERIAEVREQGGLTLLINPQWEQGQILSDFGIGPWRKRKEQLVASFQEVFYLKQFRISGDNVRLLRVYPGTWQIYLERAGGKADCIAILDAKPSYKELQELLRGVEGSSASMGWLQRAQAEWEFNRKSLNDRQ